MSGKTLDERVDRIEKIFWVVAILAVIFGISGAWGLSALKNAKSEIDSLQDDLKKIRSFVEDAQNFVEDAKSQIATEKERQLNALVPEVRTMAQNEIVDQFKGRIAYIKTGGHITKLGKYSTVSLPVKKGDIIYASYAASAKDSEFYYRIVDVNGLAKPLTESVQVVQNSNQPWRSISTFEVFRVNTNRVLKLAVEFFKVDVSGRVQVFGSTLVAVKVASDGG